MAPAAFDALRERIRTRLVETAVPSLAVAVVQHGRTVWEEGFGWADREARVPATPHTMYSLASISKPMTATALMVLVQRGLIDLDRPVNAYLGDAPLRARVGDADAATVRRVAGHTSGLPLHHQFFYADEPQGPPSRAETIRRYGHLLWAPGERYQYSNLGYGVLDHLIARVSGRPYGDFMREEVFIPLGMTRASLHVAPRLEPFQALRYGADGVAYPHYGFDHDGGSALYCSAHDLARFGAFHLKAHLADQRAILSDASIDAMQQTPPPGSPGEGYAVGWGVQPDAFGHLMVGHGGGMGGVATTLRLYPRAGLALVVLANAADALPHVIADDIAALLLPGYRERMEADAAARARAPAVPLRGEVGPDWEVTPELLGTWRGSVSTYEGEMPLVLRFGPADAGRSTGSVQAHLGRQLWSLVNEPVLRDGWFCGELAGEIETADARRRPHRVRLDLRLRDGVLNGAAVAVSGVAGDGGAPGRRAGNALSHWAELRRGGQC